MLVQTHRYFLSFFAVCGRFQTMTWLLRT